MDSRLKEDIQRLAKTRPTVGASAASPKANPVDPVTSTGAVRAAASTGGGIASPLTEPDAAMRTYHTSRNISTSDGVFTFVVYDLATIDMLDATGASVVMEFDAP